MSAGEANLYGLAFLIPSIFLIVVPFIFLWPDQFSKESIKYYLEARENLTLVDFGIGILTLLLGIVAHEFLHGLGWSFYAKKRWKAITFGVNWKLLTPYCHCNEHLRLKAYRIGSILPAIILGIVPAIISILIGHIGLLVFGFFFTFAAGGDFMILWLLRKERSGTLVQDHPHLIGCIVIDDPPIVE